MDLLRFFLSPLRWFEWLCLFAAMSLPFFTSNVIFVAGALFNTAFYWALWGGRAVAGVAKMKHPEVFADLEPDKKDEENN